VAGFGEADERNMGLKEPLAPPEHALFDHDPRPGCSLKPGLDDKLVVELRGFQIVGLDPAYSEENTFLGLQPGLVDAEGADPFRPCPFDEFQVVGVIDDAGKIGILVIDADREFMAIRLSLVIGSSLVSA
jgi:hypothetical protein